jgi:hypothetical protein
MIHRFGAVVALAVVTLGPLLTFSRATQHSK